jgi:hypothetical protein
VSETTVKVPGVPLKATAVVPVNAAPVMVTAVPTPPLVGVKELMVGATGARGAPILLTKA